jgi:hypothetical protein|tara:strand:- start:903 stop:1139 length:237 start_codon:yes stop_codon:yes gene_type:complete
MDYKKEYKKIGNKRISDLTLKDKDVLYNYYLREAIDNFGTALGYAEECGIKELKDMMYEAKSMCFDVEEKGIRIGSMN